MPYPTSRQNSSLDEDKDFKKNPNYLTKKFDLAAMKRDLCASKYGVNRRTKADFYECIHNFLEAIAKCMNLGDQVICWHHLRSKPRHM